MITLEPGVKKGIGQRAMTHRFPSVEFHGLYRLLARVLLGRGRPHNHPQTVRIQRPPAFDNPLVHPENGDINDRHQ